MLVLSDHMLVLFAFAPFPFASHKDKGTVVVLAFFGDGICPGGCCLLGEKNQFFVLCKERRWQWWACWLRHLLFAPRVVACTRLSVLACARATFSLPRLYPIPVRYNDKVLSEPNPNERLVRVWVRAHVPRVNQYHGRKRLVASLMMTFWLLDSDLRRGGNRFESQSHYTVDGGRD